MTGWPSPGARLEPAVSPELLDALEQAIEERIRMPSAAFRGGDLLNAGEMA